MSAATEEFRQARDRLLSSRSDYATALQEFAWPDVGDTFNWAHDWFDQIADGNDKPALVVIGQDDVSTTLTFEQMRTRSN